MAGGLNVDVAAVPLAELAHVADHIFLGRVEHQVGAALFSQCQPRGHQIQGDQQAGILEPRRSHHAQPQRAAARDHHRVAQFDLAALHGVDGAGQRLNVHCLPGRQALGQLVVDGVVAGKRIYSAMAPGVRWRKP